MKKSITLKGSFTIQHLLPCSGGYLMVEGGGENEFSSFLNRLNKYAIDPEEIRYLFITHHHEDHAGFAATLQEVSGCHIIAHKKAVQFLEKGRHSDTGGGILNWKCVFLGLYLFIRGVRFSFTPVKFGERDFIVEEDDYELLRSLGVPGIIVHTPGHSPDSISLLLDDGSCFCGDAAMSSMQWLGNHHCCIYISDMEEYYRSWQKMIQAGARTIYPAHGEPFPAEKLAQKMNHFKQEDLLFAKNKKK